MKFCDAPLSFGSVKAHRDCSHADLALQRVRSFASLRLRVAWAVFGQRVACSPAMASHDHDHVGYTRRKFLAMHLDNRAGNVRRACVDDQLTLDLVPHPWVAEAFELKSRSVSALDFDEGDRNRGADGRRSGKASTRSPTQGRESASRAPVVACIHGDTIHRLVFHFLIAWMWTSTGRADGRVTNYGRCK